MKEGHFTMIRWSIHQEDITVITVYVPSKRPAKYRKQKLTELKERTENPQSYLEILTFPSQNFFKIN